MDKRELELIYMDYLNSLKPSENFTQKEYKINFDLKKKIIEKFKQPLNVLPKYEKEKTNEIVEGQIYLFFKNNIPIFFVVIDEIDDLYEVLKMSNYWELGNQHDLLTKVNDEMFIVETWNKFYLTEDEIKSSILYGNINKEDLETLTKYLNDEIEELPEHKRGLKVPLDKKYVQIKFHQQESRLVREYELRPLLMDDEDYE